MNRQIISREGVLLDDMDRPEEQNVRNAPEESTSMNKQSCLSKDKLQSSRDRNTKNCYYDLCQRSGRIYLAIHALSSATGTMGPLQINGL